MVQRQLCRRVLSSASLVNKTQLTDLDSKWAKRWLKESGSFHPGKEDVDPNAPSFYCLSMFPYPLGVLHMGHLRVYTVSDVMARFKRLKGYNVIHPMGWDAFGLPAENAAVERGVNPAVWTKSNIEKMKDQMHLMLADFDWDREVTTCSPEYYKWTQKIFLMLYERGLAYRKEAEINWDPVDKTVLANEQVDADGRSWRSGALVEKRNLKQWFIGITKYAEALEKDLKILDRWPLKVKAMQKNWIGTSKGAEIKFPTNNGGYITIYTSRPDTLFSVQFVAVALNHPVVQEAAKSDPKLRDFIEEMQTMDDPESKDGYLLQNVKVSIPMDCAGDRRRVFDIPVYVAPYVLGSYGHGAVMGCPGHDDRDYAFWRLHNGEKPILQVVSSGGETPLPFTGKKGTLETKLNEFPLGLQDLGDYAGMKNTDAGKKISRTLATLGMGGPSTQFKIRDWLISRQRFWGAPIPIVHCDNCGTVPVPDDQLPVLLPNIEGEIFGKGNPLTKFLEFTKTTCPKCGSENARRETDTMDTFMDSSWYFFRYLDAHNTAEPFNKEMVSRHIPVDMYIGGVEHAILHLLYSRFLAKFLADAGMWDSELAKSNHYEPFLQLVTQGMVHGKTYTDPDTGRFLKPDELDERKLIKATGATPRVSFEKMSKSKYNGADPAECITKYGADATRAHMLFLAPLSDELNWNEEHIAGITRWLDKVLSLATQVGQYVLDNKQRPSTDEIFDVNSSFKLYNGAHIENAKLNQVEFDLINKVSALVTRISNLVDKDLGFNTIISDYMKITNELISAMKSDTYIDPRILLHCYEQLVVVMAPVTPSVAEEAWEVLHHAMGEKCQSVFYQQFPEALVLSLPYTQYNVFINGKARGSFKGLKALVDNPDQLLQLVLSQEPISKHVTGDIKKVITKPGVISLITTK